MTAKLFMLLSVLLVDLSPCSGQIVGGMMGATIIGQQALNSLNEAVHFIVGPQASPDHDLIAFAFTQGGPPTNMMQMIPYIGYLQRIAYATYGTWLANMAATPAQVSSANTPLEQLKANLDNIIMQRSVQYMSLPTSQRAGAGVDMAALGTMLLQ